jgi:hypothetical protein
VCGLRCGAELYQLRRLHLDLLHVRFALRLQRVPGMHVAGRRRRQLHGHALRHQLRDVRLLVRLQFLRRLRNARRRRRELHGNPVLHDVLVVRLVALQFELLHRVHLGGRRSGKLLGNALFLQQLDRIREYELLGCGLHLDAER